MTLGYLTLEEQLVIGYKSTQVVLELSSKKLGIGTNVLMNQWILPQVIGCYNLQTTGNQAQCIPIDYRRKNYLLY